MFTRITILMFIAVLALPAATLTQPSESRHLPWGAVAVEAKGKKPTDVEPSQITTVTRTERQLVTQTFVSTQPLTISAAPNGAPAQAAPYPAAMMVSGFTNGEITDINVTLAGFSNSFPEDVDVLLSSSDGRRALVMSNVGSAIGVTGLTLMLDDQAAAPLPRAKLSSGTYRPTDVNIGTNVFVAPAPAPDGNVALSTFDGADPNGIWQFWVMDEASNDASAIAGGWTLEITAEVDVLIEDQEPLGDDPQNSKDKKDKKHKKHKNKKHKNQGNGRH